MTQETDWDPEDVAAAKAAMTNCKDIGFLPGTVAQKFTPVVRAQRDARIVRNTEAGVTSFAVKPMRQLQFRKGGF